MTNRISLLDNRLANQIAAGEVVERPASVIKELLENSIDSGATRIEVEVERGGTRLIRVTDNGSGIHKSDLELALTRHATSKIHTADDLANIQSLGFRGEALASISSVSRLTLTSRTADSELAWQAVAQGRDMKVEISPASAAIGTRIEVADLFFNTPARQKFLRTEKTEFNHIEEVFKRQALANFEIAFVLKHNYKIVKRVPAVAETAQQGKRVATICGQPFIKSAVSFECEHESIKIWGWLGKPDFHRSESDIQFVFINRRPVKDKTLNHAIRQAYDGLLPAGRMSAFVVFLEIDARQVDVNVHPTKHEVRFSEQRLVHDLLVKSVSEALADCQVTLPIQPVPNQPVPNQPESNPVSGSLFVAETSSTSTDYQSVNGHSTDGHSLDDYSPVTNRVERQHSNSQVRRRHQQLFSQAETSPAQQSLNNSQSMTYYADAKSAHLKTVNPELNTAEGISQSQSNNGVEAVGQVNGEPGKFLLEISSQFWVTEVNRKLYALDIPLLLKDYVASLLTQHECQTSKPLLFPQRLQLAEELIEDYANHQLLQRLGFRFQAQDDNYLLLNQIPLWLQSVPLQAILLAIPEWLLQYQQSPSGNDELAQSILAAIDAPDEKTIRAIVDEQEVSLTSSKACRLISVDVVASCFND